MDRSRQEELLRNLNQNKFSTKAEKEKRALDADLARIAALTKVARGNWFALIAALAFLGITLMGSKHIDFYDLNKQTKLPALGVDVPIAHFFLLAPFIVLLLYGFFHLYLLKLWAALMRAPSAPNGVSLGEQVPPWLVIDFALFVRRNRRNGVEPAPLQRRPLGSGLIANR